VIATTMFDAFATADLVASDLSSHPPTSAAPPLPIEALRGSKQVVSWEDWERIDNEERKRGRASGKVREKMTDVAQMFAFLN
jgi:adrenodoxin-NADP+ reductase